MTEIGRRAALLTGGAAFSLSVLIGILTNGDLMWTLVVGLITGVIFGAGGLLVGNLAERYVYQAAQREIARRTMERKIAEELVAQDEIDVIEEESEEG